jgi:serine/threonine protein kinase
MAELIEIAQAVNDGERRVLKALRDGLSDDWVVLGDFEVPSHGRPYECDALAVNPAGWAYLIETKQYDGQIEGNDRQWKMPSKTGSGYFYVDNPVGLLRRKVKKLATMFKGIDEGLVNLRLYPLVVVASETRLALTGNSAVSVVLVGEVAEYVAEDPRPHGQAGVDAESVRSAIEEIKEKARPLQPSGSINAWDLIDLVDETATFQVWSARNSKMGPDAPLVRLKLFRFDTLATGANREAQQQLARSDLRALLRLNSTDGAALVLNNVEETDDCIAVVTAWPEGPTLASVMDQELTADEAQDIADALVTALASVHAEGIVHRALTPRTAHLLEEQGRVVLTDFDFGRVPNDPSITAYLPDDWASDYTAPEVRGDPSAASAASDVWSAAAIVVELFGDDFRTGDPDSWANVPDEWNTALKRALVPSPTTRTPNASVLLADLRDSSGRSDGPPAGGLLPNDVLSKRWVVRGQPKSGGIADVYRVDDTELTEEFAAKFLQEKYIHDDEEDENVGIVAEYKRVRKVPLHPNLALPEFIERLESYQRNRREYSWRARFLLTPWIEGDSLLDELKQERIPLARTVDIVDRLAAGLAHLHAHGLLHRDVKPANVIIGSSTGEPVLVDFNIAAQADEAGDTQVGTPAYLPPDLAETKWSQGCDTFMLGLTACEMLAGRTLGSRQVGDWLEAAELPTEVEAALRRATAPASERFDRPEEFATDLRAAFDSVAERSVEVHRPPPERAVTRPNHNPFRDEINRLFSQSRESNAGTRGLDEFAAWSYVPTRVDRDLRAAVLDGRHALVLITGNAGDGKTAFIQKLESDLVGSGASRQVRPGGNGSVIEHQGRRFETNWDGSQDEGRADNDAVLESFFSPFVGEDPSPAESETRLIAINEGRLLDFISHEDRRGTFPTLCRAFQQVLEGREHDAGDWLVVVNLNLRALTLSGDQDGSDIVSATLDRLSDGRLWEACERCAARQHCYASNNAALLRDPILGPRAKERIRQTLDLVRMRRRLHITMRDLRSCLAFVVAGNRPCDEIVALAEEGVADVLVAGQLPNALFGAAEDVALFGDQSATRDRLLAALAPIDVGRTADPAEDVRLWALGPDALPQVPDELRGQQTQLADLRATARAEQGTPEGTALTRFVHGSLRRTQFITRDGTGWTRMFPYRRLAEFQELLDTLATSTDLESRDRLARAISYSEGLFNDHFACDVGVRLAGENEGSDRSYVRHSARRFSLGLLDESKSARYVEYRPDTQILSFDGSSSIALEIDLDLYETLGRISDGFVPSREELRGAWLNLRVFKDLLARVPTDTLLLSLDDQTFFQISRADDGGELILDALTQ